MNFIKRLRRFMSPGYAYSPGGIASREKFTNRGTTSREMEVAKLLNKNKRMLGSVKMVRFANYTKDDVFVVVELFGNGPIQIGRVSKLLTAEQQTEEILQSERIWSPFA